MNNNLFRKKSVDRVNSPEQLNDYIRVCNPSLWMVLAAAILLLSGAIIWGIFGELETRINTVAVARDGRLTVYVKAADLDSVKGKQVTVNDVVYSVTQEQCTGEPVAVDAGFSEYMLYVGTLNIGEWVYPLVFETDTQNGVYEATSVVESVTPMSFVLN